MKKNTTVRYTVASQPAGDPNDPDWNEVDTFESIEQAREAARLYTMQWAVLHRFRYAAQTVTTVSEPFDW